MFHAKKKQKSMQTPLEVARMYDENLNTDKVLFSFFYNRIISPIKKKEFPKEKVLH